MQSVEVYFIQDVENIINRNRQTIRRWCKRGIFPKPTLIANQQAWAKKDICDWLNVNFPSKP